MSKDGRIGKTEGEFSTVQFFKDSFEYVRRYVSAEEAVEASYHYVTCPAARIGIIVKVIVTDGGDDTVFCWEFGKGVTWPTESKAFGQYKWS